MRLVLSEAQAWIDSAQSRDDEDRELTFKEFSDLIGDSIGQKRMLDAIGCFLINDAFFHSAIIYCSFADVFIF